MILGGGNMGGAIVRGLISGGSFPAKDIMVVDFSKERLNELKAFNDDVQLYTSIEESRISDVDLFLLAVKPWQIQSVLSDLKFKLDYSRQAIVSIAAGVTFEQLNAYLKKDTTVDPIIFRVIPNTAIAVRQSMTFISSCNANNEQESSIITLFNELGKAILIPENQMSAATALASCGIAYAMRYVRAASEGGVELGFYPDIAKEIVLQTVKGAVELLVETGTHPEVEIDKVTTPGGITIKGLNEMEQAGFTSAVIKGLKKSAAIN